MKNYFVILVLTLFLKTGQAQFGGGGFTSSGGGGGGAPVDSANFAKLNGGNIFSGAQNATDFRASDSVATARLTATGAIKGDSVHARAYGNLPAADSARAAFIADSAKGIKTQTTFSMATVPTAASPVAYTFKTNGSGGGVPQYLIRNVATNFQQLMIEGSSSVGMSLNSYGGVGAYIENHSLLTFAIRQGGGDIVRWTWGTPSTTNMSIGTNADGTARLHLPAGTATASSAPLKFTSGTNLTTAEAGAMEFDGTELYFSPSTTRHTVNRGLKGSATLDFPSTAGGLSSDLTITVTGVADGDVVSLGAPNGSVPVNGTFFAWVSATNTVTVRYANNDLITARDPASGTFKVFVTK